MMIDIKQGDDCGQQEIATLRPPMRSVSIPFKQAPQGPVEDGDGGDPRRAGSVRPSLLWIGMPRMDTSLAQLGKQRIETLDGDLGATGCYVTAIQEGVQINLFSTTLGGQFNHGGNMVLMAMNAAF